MRFRTKPQLAQTMLTRALAGGLRPGGCWAMRSTAIIGRSGSGSNSSGNPTCWPCGARPRCDWPTPTPGAPPRGDAGRRAAAHRVAAAQCRRGQQRPAVVRLGPAPLAREEQTRGHHALLIRRHPTSGERAYYLVFSLRPIRRDAVVPIAGQRWAIEQSFEESKQEVGLDEYEVRTYDAWYRFMTLTLYAHAFLAAMRARQRPRKRGSARDAIRRPERAGDSPPLHAPRLSPKCPPIRRTSSPPPGGAAPSRVRPPWTLPRPSAMSRNCVVLTYGCAVAAP